MCAVSLMAEYHSLLASDKPCREIFSQAKSSKLSAVFRLRSNLKLIVFLRVGKGLEIMFILKCLRWPIKTPKVIDLVDFMSRHLHNLLEMNDS